MLIASNIDELERVVAKFGKARTAVLMKHSGGEVQIDPSEGPDRKAAALAFAREMQAAAQLLHDVDLDMIDPAELKGDENAYPPSVLAGLMPVLKRAKKTSSAAA
jgi:hypothetical protein